MATASRHEADRHRRVTLADVAARAGVSRSTASRALAGNARISRATRALVLEAAEALAYVPNQTARSLRLRQTRSLGILLSDLADPDHAQFGAGFEQQAAAAGFSVVVVAARKRVSDEGRAMRVLQERAIDGICIAASSLDPTEVRQVVWPTPVVVVQPDHPGLVEELDRLPDGIIRSDDVGGVAEAVRHLLAGGYRDIAYLGVGANATNRVRGEAADRALREVTGRPMRAFQVEEESWRRPKLVAQALGSVLPEAVVCYDDKLAIGLLDGLRSRGVRVPDDVAVVGYDGIPFAAFSNPRLTTVATPTVHMGALAVDFLVEAIETGKLPEARTVPVELIVRESSGACRSVEPAECDLAAGPLEPEP
jgi:LacI family transcriptional regulator